MSFTHIDLKKCLHIYKVESAGPAKHTSLHEIYFLAKTRENQTFTECQGCQQRFSLMLNHVVVMEINYASCNN